MIIIESVKELEHFLAILVENVLYTRLQVVDESNIDEKGKESLRKDMLQKFIDNLPETYKNLDRRDEIISYTLKRTMKSSEKKNEEEIR